jgi:geranylgeranylglycerol-phosphate geranylgeranyltransferase
MASLAPVLAAAFGYARNDAVDAAADLENRPGRPVPSGRVGSGAALAAAWICLGLAVLVAALTARDYPHLALVAVGAAALYFYSPWLKALGPAGPATVSLLAGLAVVWGGLTGPHPSRSLAAAGLAAAVTFARECAKDLEDEPGDRAAGKRSWTVRSGSRSVLRGLRAATAVALLLTAVPWLLRDVRVPYLALAGGLSAPLLLWVLVRPPVGVVEAKRASLALKVALVAGIIGLGVGA